MQIARIAILGIAILAGGLAAMLASGPSDPPPAPAQVVVPKNETEVLVAAGDIGMGNVVRGEDLVWRAWPKEGAAGFITRSEQPGAAQEFIGGIARQPMAAGEPVRAQKIIKANGSGFMSAILAPGMRALATEISAETGAGGFILPGDRVDVILTRRNASNTSGRDEFTSNTLLTNVRVLAIDQTIGEKDGQRVVVGRTATLELQPSQTETLALARQMGTLSLALRSLADSNPQGETTPQEGLTSGGSGMTVVRYGIATQTYQR